MANMDFHEYKIGKKQAEEFAKAIFADIETYVNEHLEEFEEFCLKEESEVKENDVKKRSLSIYNFIPYRNSRSQH